MRLLIDQDVYATTISLLRSAGHEVVRSGEVLGPTASDASILELAQREGRVVVTRDHDYGRLVHGGPGSDAGVLLLRFRGKALDEVHAQLLRVLASHTVEDLQGVIVTVEPGRHRFHRLTSGP